MEMNFELLKETKTCYRFESRSGDNFTTLYLKKSDIDKAGIDPHKGITITIKETN